VQRQGSGPRVLLIHGTGATTHSWRGLTPLLAERSELLSFDLPGHGFTRGRLPGGLSLTAVAGAIAGLLRQEDFPPDLVVGHSAGAAIAVQLALEHQLHAPVIAIAPALRPMGGEAAPFFNGAARLLLANPFTSFFAAGAARHLVDVRGFLERSTGSHIDAAGVALYARLFGSPGHVEGALGLMADWDLRRVAARLGDLPVPLTVIHGDRDAAIPAAEAQTVARLSGSDLHILPGLGHLAHEERPDLIAGIITDLIEGGRT
jgi:magnesium chelatase accessory protein